MSFLETEKQEIEKLETAIKMVIAAKKKKVPKDPALFCREFPLFSIKLSFQRLHITHMSLGRFKPSGGRFGMGCRTGTHFSLTTKKVKPKSYFASNLCSNAINPKVRSTPRI